MLAEVRLSQPPPDALTMNSTGDAFAIIAPFGDGWYRVIAWHRHDQPPEDTPVSLDEVREVTRQALGTDYGMHDPRWMSRFHSEERQVPRYRDGRVLLAGDAAHVHSPAGGQGMNTGIQDAANLGWKLAATVQGWAPAGLLDTYQAERHPVGGRSCARATRCCASGSPGRPHSSPPAPPGLRRTRIPFPARRWPAAISGLASATRRPTGAHPLTGKRVADLNLADGRRLYEALRGGRFLLAASPGALPADRGQRLRRPRGSRGYIGQASGTVAPIRPDAYIAWATGSAGGQGDAWRDATDQDAAEIRAALARWCGAPERPGGPGPAPWPALT